MTPISRRALFAATGAVVATGAVAAAVGSSRDTFRSTAEPLDGVDDPHFDELTPFADELRIPPTLQPKMGELNTIEMIEAHVRWHSQLPPSRMWTYAGQYPGPTIECRRDVPTRIAWTNRLTGTSPVRGVWVNPRGPRPGRLPFNRPGAEGGYVRDEVAALTPWTTVHLHGGHQNGIHDGGTEYAVTEGNSQLCEYPNPVATHLFYHDHAMSVTALNVMSGLVGNYFVRDDHEPSGLPDGGYEIPLLISDVNFDTDSNNLLTGQLLAKRVLGGTTRTDAVTRDKIPFAIPFYGPFTAVNGVVWPYLNVHARTYRFRVLNASLTRTYRMVVLDEQSRQPVRGAFTVIGTDLGLLGAPQVVDQEVTLAPAERADLVIDFASHAGRRLTVVNTVAGTAPGDAAPAAGLAHPAVMQFRVDRRKVTSTPLPTTLASDYHRLSVRDIPPKAVERFVITGYDETAIMPQLWEMQDTGVDGQVADMGTRTDTAIVQLQTPGGLVNLRRVATTFEDTTTFFTTPDTWEKWTFVNVTPPGPAISHPMHIHLMNFQIVDRRSIDSSGMDFRTGRTTRPIAAISVLPITAEESGWKDTVNVAPNTVVTIFGKFAPQTGKAVYHCHYLDHEDEGMMRPLVVMPASVGNIHTMLMKTMGVHDR